jgi:pyridoxine 5-phosphate synthase
MRLGVNIDHVATIRQARKTIEPDLLRAALTAQKAGAHQITVHLRADRRHIQDEDLRILKNNLSVPLNIEMSVKKEMRDIAVKTKPHKVTLVPERRNEVTTEGGLDVIRHIRAVKKFIEASGNMSIFDLAVFVDPEIEQIQACIDLGLKELEINTGSYADCRSAEELQNQLLRIKNAAAFACQNKMAVAAGHGLTMRNMDQIIKIREIEELNIGHHIIADAIFVGLQAKVEEILDFIA